jgi:hypothetical protein
MLGDRQEPYADLDVTAHALNILNEPGIGSAQHVADMLPR